MRTHSLLRSCSIVLSLLHLVILLSLFYPLSSRGGLWQMLFANWSNPESRLPDLELFALFLFGPLIVPPLASWVVCRFPGRIVSLFSLYIGMGMLLVGCLFFSGLLWSPPALSWSSSSLLVMNLAYLVSRIPLFGFSLSFILCLALAICLPLVHARERITLRASWSEGLTFIMEERRDRPHSSEGEARPSRASQDFRLPIYAFLGLLCHLLIFLSLFATYIDYYNVYQDTDLHPQGGGGLPTPSTGWQLLAQPFQSSPYRPSNMPPPSLPIVIALMAALLLPALVYLASLMLWRVRSPLKDSLLGKSIFVSYLLNLLGLSLSTFCIVFSFLSTGGDLHDPVQHTYGAFVMPPIAFLLSLICSYLLIKYFRRHFGWGGQSRKS